MQSPMVRPIASVAMVVFLCLLGSGPFVSGQDLSWWQTSAQRAEAAKPKLNPVDVNRASMDELMKLPGMSRVWAVRIVKFRPYANKYALKQEGVLPGNVYERLMPYLVAHREK